MRKLKIALNYRDSHTDDVTALAFHPLNPNWMISCSTDNLLCHFNWEEKPTKNEEDTLEGVYSSE
jgi:WD40 repeat protein